MSALALGTAAALSGCAAPLSKAKALDAPNLADAVLAMERLGQEGSASPTAGSQSASSTAPRTSGPMVIANATDPNAGQSHAIDQIIDRLDPPTDGRPEKRLALTIDDGRSADVVAAYIDFLKASRLRATFFVTASFRSWTDVSDALRPMVDSGQVQLANHTWDHPDITKLSAKDIAVQLNRTERFLWNQYGVRGTPFFRPPYGFHNELTDELTRELGFRHTVMWLGSLGDAAPLSGDEILAQARQWFGPGRVVIGHANYPGVTRIYPQLLDLIKERSLWTVTLNDAFGT